MAKRSRRERRLETDKPRLFSPVYTPTEAAEVSTPLMPKAPEVLSPTPRKIAPILNFAQEYYYVYSELKTILILTLLMFGVMVGLSFVI